MKNSSGNGYEGAKGMKRIILIKDKITLASWGFAFVEFIDTQVLSNISYCHSNIIDPVSSLLLGFSHQP